MIKNLFRWLLPALLLLIACPLALADIPVEIYGPAPDPGAPPRTVPVGFVAVSCVFVVIAVISLLSAFRRGKIGWQPTFVSAFVVLLLAVVGLAITMSMLPPSEDYQQWQEAHRKWQDKEQVIIGYEPPSRRDPDEFFD